MNINKNEKFNVKIEILNGVCMVYFIGELDLLVVFEFCLVMELFVDNKEQDLIINMKDLKYIDSIGIGILLFVLKV